MVSVLFSFYFVLCYFFVLSMCSAISTYAINTYGIRKVIFKNMSMGWGEDGIFCKTS